MSKSTSKMISAVAIAGVMTFVSTGALAQNYGTNNWLPDGTVTSVWNGTEFAPSATSTNTYTPEGRLASVISLADGTYTQTDYTYDAEGRLVESIVSSGTAADALSPVSRTVMGYDAIVKNFCILTETYTHNGTDWEIESHESYDVVRDSRDRVIEVSYLYGVEDVDDPEDMTHTMMTIAYDTNGNPKNIQHSEGVYDPDWEEWNYEEDEGYNNCTWEICDNQIITLDDVCNERNHLLSATYTTAEGKDYAAATVEWSNATDYTMKHDIFLLNGSRVRSYSHVAQPNGGYDYIETEDEKLPTYESFTEKVHSVRYDSYGILTLDKQTAAYDGDPASTKAHTETTVTYNATTGWPETAETQVWSKANGLQNTERVEWTYKQEAPKARFADDLLSYFDGVDCATWEVEVQEDASAPGVYTLVNPYGNGNCPSVPELSGKSMVIDASNPEAVVLKTGGSGLVFNENLGEMGWTSAPEVLSASGYSLDEIAAAGYCGTLAGNVITFPKKSIYLTFEKYPDVRIPRNLEGDFRVILPGGKDHFVKIKSDYCTASETIDYVYTTGADVTKAKVAVYPHSVYLSPENYDALMENATDLALDVKTGTVDFSQLKRLDGSAATQAAVCIFVLDDETDKAVADGYALLHHVDPQEGEWENIGTGRFCDDITTLYADAESKIYDVTVERNIANPGLVRVVNPFGAYTGVTGFDTANEHVGAHSHYMVFDITNPDKVSIVESPLGIDLGSGPMVLTSVMDNLGAEITGTLSGNDIEFPTRGMGVYEAGSPNDLYFVNKDGKFRLRLPDMSGIGSIATELKSGEVDAVYDAQGRKLNTVPAKGISIIRYTDGTVRKTVR